MNRFYRMNNPTSYAYTKGICGDEMEFYLDIKAGIIEDVSYYTENGCSHTRNAAKKVADFVSGKPVFEALKVNPVEISGKDNLDLALESGFHCYILSVITFMKAAADYLIQVEES